MVDMWDQLDNEHIAMTESMHTRQLNAYYPDHFSTQTADCIAFNKLLNANRNKSYCDVYGNVKQVPMQNLKVNIYYKPGNDNGISYEYKNFDLPVGRIDATERVLREEPTNPVYNKYTKKDDNGDGDWFKVPQTANYSKHPIALLPHQQQDQWPIDPFRFGSKSSSLSLPNRQVVGYSSLGKIEDIKTEEVSVPKPTGNSGASSYYPWPRK
eukprot:NODE_69_length_23719_cov_0.556689.p13 type:complete len:211 gc:universal NODE_69_length_23719_cov_0.556689:5967-6599(+)